MNKITKLIIYFIVSILLIIFTFVYVNTLVGIFASIILGLISIKGIYNYFKK